jgi:hypothetical protein
MQGNFLLNNCIGVQGTLDHTVRDKLRLLKCPTLLVTGLLK